MKALQQYFKKRKSAITFLLEQQQESFTADTFHILRLELKKLKALFDLINSCFKNFKQKKITKPFQLIFSQAGKIRELQVEEALLEEHFGSDYVIQYRNELKKIAMEETKNFFLTATPSFAEKLQKKYIKINTVLRKVNKKRTNRYMGKKRTEIEKLLHKKGLKNKQMHALRKRLKEYQFNQKIFNSNNKNKLLPDKNALPELLGEWHDYQMVIQHLKKAMKSGEIIPEENNTIKNGIKTFTSESELLFNAINTTLKNMLQKSAK
jgi:CHAD domain-containing protein